MTTPSKPKRVHHPLFARAYARLAPSAESAGVAEHRDELLAGLRGRVVEIGAGPGLNFAHYPATVGEVVAVEPEPHFRRRAAAARSEVPVHLVAIAAAGFTVTHVRRFEFEPRGIALPVSPHVIGSAVWRSAQPRLPGRAERTVRPET